MPYRTGAVARPAQPRALSAAAVLLLALAGCGDSPAPAASAPPAASPAASPATTAPSPGAPPGQDPAARAAAVVRTLSDEDLAGQVLMPYAYGAAADRVDAVAAAGNRQLGGVDTPAELVRKFRLGGLVLVGFTAGDPTGGTNPTTNVDDPAQVRALTAGLQRTAATLPGGAPLLIGTDQEYGVVTRVRTGVTALPAAMAFGAAGDPARTRAAWRAAGTELAAMGVTVDFAPVADTLRPGGNTVIGSRAYGEDPRTTAAQVAAAVHGLQDGGVQAALKHFPGHGRTTGDSHEGLPVVPGSRADWTARDRPAFAAGIGAGAAVVMSGHLDVPALDPGVPATFSRKVMTDELRGRLKFTGVAVTDAMNMPPARRWPAGEAAVRALLAGNDLLLMPPDIAAARDGVLAALRDGRLPRARLVEAVTRVLTLKFRGAARPQPAATAIGSPGHVRDVRAAAAAAVTVLRGRCSGRLVPPAVTVTAAPVREPARAALERELRAAGVAVRPGAAAVHLVGYGDTTRDLRRGAAVTVAMDTPYLLGRADSGTLVATYSSSPLSMDALADVLAGRAKPTGSSPVAVPGLPRTACR